MRRNGDAVAIYSRKSRFTGKGESIGNQTELCREHIRMAFGETAAEGAVVFEDEGFSGGNLKRPSFQTMMERVRKREFRAIVVYRLDRISRNISDFTHLIDELTRLDVAFVSIREQFDTSTPMGRAMMFIISVFSQLERETIAERIRDNMHELAKTGRWLGGNTPTGFRSEEVTRVSVEGKARKAYRLAVIPEEAMLVRAVFDTFTEKGSLTGAETELLRRGVKSKRGQALSRFAIKGILQNPVYLTADEAAYGYFSQRGVEVFSGREEFDGQRGVIAYNRTRQEKGRAAELLPMQEWIVAAGAHPGLIPSGQWIQAQEALERNKKKSYRTARKNQALLTGLLYCRCGARMYPKLSQRENGAGELRYSYVCKGKERSRGSSCQRGNADGNRLDGLVMERLGTLPMDMQTAAAMLEEGRKELEQHKPDEAAVLWDGVRENRRKIAALVDALAQVESPIAAKHITERIEALDQESKGLERRLSEIEKAGGKEAGLAELAAGMASLSGCVAGMTVEEKREMLRRLVRRAVWDGTELKIWLIDSNEVGWKEKNLYHWGEDSK